LPPVLAAAAKRQSARSIALQFAGKKLFSKFFETSKVVVLDISLGLTKSLRVKRSGRGVGALPEIVPQRKKVERRRSERTSLFWNLLGATPFVRFRTADSMSAQPAAFCHMT
jgi:hypothetical protein